MTRFKGDAGKKKLVELLGKCPLLAGIDGNTQVARKLAQCMQVRMYEPTNVLIQQGTDGDDVLFILLGSVKIEVNGHSVAHRVSGDTVGEIAAMSSGEKRSADVIAREQTTVGEIAASDFNRIVSQKPDIWRNLAEILASRLGQRNALHREPNKVPIIFIGSSGDSLEVAKAIESGLNAQLGARCDIHCWDENVFQLSEGTIESLEKESAEVDFAVLVAAADDTEMRGGKEEEKWVARDNVVFEAGLFMGALSRNRTFVACPSPQGIPERADFKLPSDLNGVTTARYTDATNLGDTVDQIVVAVENLGVVTRFRSNGNL